MGSALTENIALLSLCGSTLQPLSETEVPLQNFTQGQNYTLSIRHEQQIAEAFAILLANTDDPSAVGAVCLEERSDGTGLLVRTAVNSGGQETRLANFEKIASTLRQCAVRRDLDTFFGEIVNTCKPRLLARLRSSHAKDYRNMGRPPIISKLIDGMKLLNDLPTRPHQLASIDAQISLLNKAFIDLESLPALAVNSQPGTLLLKNILLIINRMLTSTDIHLLLERIPKTIPSWSGPASQSLAKSLKSLAQYYDAAHYLLRRARMDPVFCNLSVAGVPDRLYRESPNSAEPHSVASGLFTRPLIQQTRLRDSVPINLEAILKRTRLEIESCIRTHAAQSKRVHAEIQLLLYYEANNSTTSPPRIICSNKHACLLCDLFIKAHGRFYIRSCHGRLYPRWRIPVLQDLQLSERSTGRIQQAIDELNRQLEVKIRQYLCQARVKISDPQESIIFVPGLDTPSVLSTATDSTSAVEAAITPDSENGSSEIASSKPAWISHVQRSPQLYMLDHGDPIEIRVYPGTPIRIHSKRIHLELTYEWAPLSQSSTFVPAFHTQSPQTETFSLLVQVELVTEDHSVLSSNSRHVYDLESSLKLEDISRGVLLNSYGLVLKKKDNFIVLRAM